MIATRAPRSWEVLFNLCMFECETMFMVDRSRVSAGQSAEAPGLTANERRSYAHDGYVVARSVFSFEEVTKVARHFDDIANAGRSIPGHWEPRPDAQPADDPLARFPRFRQPHHVDDLSRRLLLDHRLYEMLQHLMEGAEPLAVQSMFYFKPPGARGQAFHQDNFYLEVRPGTCIAAWIAIDSAMPENGGLHVVPGTHRLQVLCPEVADAAESFTKHIVRPPDGGAAPVATFLEPGDVLFFNGSLIHGSQSNRTPHTWRRSFIGHYMPASSSHIASYYKPLTFDGRAVFKETSAGGGPCGEEFTLDEWRTLKTAEF